MEIKEIIWNGCDGYCEIDAPEIRAYIRLDDIKAVSYLDSDGQMHTLHTSFKVIEVDQDTVSKDEDGEYICDGLFLIDGKFYKELQA